MFSCGHIGKAEAHMVVGENQTSFDGTELRCNSISVLLTISALITWNFHVDLRWSSNAMLPTQNTERPQ